MKVTDEMLMALADRELDAETEKALLQQVAANPALARDLEMFRETARMLREDYSIGETPPELIAAISAIKDPEAQPRSNVVPFRRKQAVTWAAMAASLALAFIAGTQLTQSSGSADLSRFADLQTGQEISEDGQIVTALGSFETDLGLCRSLSRESASLVHHEIVCRQGDQWQSVMTMNMPQSDEYLPASDTLTQAMDSFLDSIGAGPALTPEEEQKILR